MLRKSSLPLFVFLALVGAIFAQDPQLFELAQRPAAARAGEPVDEAAVAILKKHGLEQSQVMDHLSWICDVHGPRLTGSPNLRRAQHWAVERLASFGLVNAQREAWGKFGRGWRCERSVVEVVGENPWPVIAYPKAWSPSTAGRVEAECVLIGTMTAEQLEAAELDGKIVFVEEPRVISEPFDATAKRFDATDLLAMADQASPPRREGGPPRAGGPGREGVAREGGPASRPAGRPREAAAPGEDVQFRQGFQRRQGMAAILAKKKPLALCDRGFKGDYGTVFVQGASAQSDPNLPREQRVSARDAGASVVPQFTFAVEHYNRICRLLQKGIPVRLAIELKTTFFADDEQEYNVLAEIPGTDPALGRQLVMLGAHFDSWQSGTGCTDNGCGSAVVLEAARLITKVVAETGKGPRRTIRVALWSGEEQGLLGSRGYVRKHFGERGQEPLPDHALLSGYFNLDNGTGRIRGVYLQGNEAIAPIFRAWLRPFHELGASTLTLNNTGGTDHQAFDGVGLPGFQFIQDPVSYSPRTHHSNMDVYDHAVPEDLKQASTIMAAFAWHTAQRDEQLPRKPMPAAGNERGR
jgi:hypothetical protein